MGRSRPHRLLSCSLIDGVGPGRCSPNYRSSSTSSHSVFNEHLRLKFKSGSSGKVSADVTVSAVRKADSVWSRKGVVHQGDQLQYSFNMPGGLAHASFELTWNHDWAHYPTNDIDLIVLDPDGNEIDDGATVDSREVVSLDKPKAGTYQLVVIGFDVFGQLQDDGSETGSQVDTFRLRAYIP